MDGMDGMDGMDHGDASSMPGVMNDQEMDDMRGASGKAFDTMFLTQMIRHHEGAVAMAETEKKARASPVPGHRFHRRMNAREACLRRAAGGRVGILDIWEANGVPGSNPRRESRATSPRAGAAPPDEREGAA